MSIYPGQEFNRDDESIVNLGYWDPGADDDAPSEPAEDVDPAENDTEPETADAESAGEMPTVAPSNPWDTPDTAQTYAATTVNEPIIAAGEDAVSKVELIPGGVKSAVESILAVADVPVSTREFASALIVSERAVDAALDELYMEYNGYTDSDGNSHEPRGFELRRLNGGWRLYARKDFSPWVARFVTGGQGKKLTASVMETLTVIAYQQPATRGYVSQVRGVNVDAAFRTLKQRGLITETVPETGSGAAQYITTDTFLEKLGLNSLDELPKLAPFLPDINDIEIATENS
ncbi:SMC-Scp complex subunit ScpB [Rothia terrae]|uniref:SMC-Scp complex subunit ScpB n=1 Tax=Rothia terrae TaxID=396015 RepID=UPI002880D413|nr:SMC-Scp complex subunit ScpB [Rothia terrae]MDT0190333.1 SMC-Scp complex subunit ScpB [Rothia terrae]